MKNRLSFIVIAALVATSGKVQAQNGSRPSAAALAASVDSIVKTDVLAQGMPSASIVITRGKETVLERAWGVADVATGRKAETSTVYQVASISKQFTAAMILKLVDRNKLSLGDPVGKYLTGLKPEMGAITIDQLLNHTSGLKSDFRQGLTSTQESISRDSLFAMAAHDTLAVKPGTKWIYSNTGYMMLGMLIEKLYGKSYPDVLQDEIAKPLGLSSLHFCKAEKGTVAASHMRSPKGPAKAFPSLHPSLLVGNGGICSTASDLAKWNRALHGGRVISAKSYTEMTTPRGAAVGNNYGFGLFIRPAPWGATAMVHEGTTDGYATAMGWYPVDSVSVVVLYNGVPRLSRDVDGVVTAVAFGQTPEPAAPTPVVAASVVDAATLAAAVAPANAAKFVGDYEIRAGVAFSITLENGVLYLTQPMAMGGSKKILMPLSGGSYGVGSKEAPVTVSFVVDADRVTGMMTRQGGTERMLRRVN